MKFYYIISACLILCCGCQEKIPVIGPYPTQGLASWYDPHISASGEGHYGDRLTCALRKRGFGKNYLVCNLENNKCVEVRHNDFGPSRSMFRRGRIIDLSKTAFSKIADLNKGIIRVRIGEVYFEQTD